MGRTVGLPTLLIGLANVLADDEKRRLRVLLLLSVKPVSEDRGRRKLPEWTVAPPEKLPEPLPAPPEFLKLCHFCNKDLQGNDVYIYRGEMAFCSSGCRAAEMPSEEMAEEEERE